MPISFAWRGYSPNKPAMRPQTRKDWDARLRGCSNRAGAFLQRDRARIRRRPNLSVAVGKRCGNEFPFDPAEMWAALEAGGLSILEQIDVTASRLGETGRQPVIEHDDFPLRQHNLQSCLADGRLIAQFILAEKRR